MKKGVIISLTCLLTISALLYLVIRLSPGNSVIKKYSYLGNVNQFISEIQAFSATDSSIVVKITDKTGTTENGFTYYVNIEIKTAREDILYTIACKGDDKNTQTGIELVLAYDKINNQGGYSKEAKGVMPLIHSFDNNFLVRLKDQQNVQIKPL